MRVALLLPLTLAATQGGLLDAVNLRVRATAADIRWLGKLAAERRMPMILGRDVEVRQNRKGKGLYALRPLQEGELIARYRGPILTSEQFMESPSTGFYAMTLANNDVVDGEDPGRSNFVRYINHSVRAANCQASDAWDDDSPVAAVYMETTQQIDEGSELLFDYGSQYWDPIVPRFAPKRFIIDYGF